MQRLDLLPELERLFRLGFLGQPSSRAYTVAGSFVNWFAERFGMPKLRAWYGGAALPFAFHRRERISPSSKREFFA